MYKTIVARRTRRVFAALNQGDAAPLLAGLAAAPEHAMSGMHALGGERHDLESVRLWYERLLRLLPDLRFDVTSVLVGGPPWRTVVMAEWRDSALGGRYANHGVNVVRLRWGRVQSVTIHCDTQLLARALEDLAREGALEASAPPIGDVPVRRR